MRNLPDSGVPDIREYLYVDTPRVRTLLAQFTAGLPEEESSTSGHIRKWQGSFNRIVGFSRERSESDQESRSLADLHVAMLEEAAEARGVLGDISAAAAIAKNWNQERLHKALKVGALIRISSPTLLLDPAAFAKKAKKFDEVSGDTEFSAVVTQVVESLYGDSLAVRILPCGPERPKLRFTGMIADPGDYLGKDRPTLFSRLGADAQEWTTVASISRIPRRGQSNYSAQLARIAGEVNQVMRQNTDRIERAALEVLIQETGRAMEEAGLSEAPSWPAISIVPLALYRQVPAFSIEPDMEVEG
ncbi:DUF6414 family protein [Spirillospora sp. CA-294931]|uniref:DUF6414 family protein n=1 Tax=Spirillospora sp. CA-294931 TaxID=3240042 RepID=UPI003D8F4191